MTDAGQTDMWTVQNYMAGANGGAVLATTGPVIEGDQNLVAQLYDAIKADDVREFNEALSLVNTRHLLAYINTIRMHDENSCFTTSEKKTPEFNPSALVQLCVVFHAKQIFSSLVQRGADVGVMDLHGNNILHVMAYSVYYKPDDEPRVCGMFDHVQSLVSVKDLALTENHKGLRPLELAFYLGTFRLAQQCFFQIPDVHLVNVEHKGIYKVQWYDISEYEGFGDGQGKRKATSPLRLLTTTDAKHILTEEESRIMDDKLVLDWMARKFICCRPLLAIWFLIRLLFVACIFIFMYTIPGNYPQDIPYNVSHDVSCAEFSYAVTKSSVGGVVMWVIAGFGTLFVLFDVCEFIVALFKLRNRPWLRKTPEGNFKRLAVKFVTYRTTHFALAVMTMSLMLSSRSHSVGDVYSVVAMTLSVWSMFYLMEIMPGIGKYVIIFQRLLGDMFFVLIIFALFILPYSVTFHKLSTFNGQQIKCNQYFASQTDSFYNTFLIMFNMVDFRSLGLTDPTWIICMHVIYAVIVNLMLLNYFIAILSESTATLGAYKEQLFLLQRLNLSLLVENRTGWFLGWLLSALQRRVFVYREGRIYLTNITVDDNTRDNRVPAGKVSNGVQSAQLSSLVFTKHT